MLTKCSLILKILSDAIENYDRSTEKFQEKMTLLNICPTIITQQKLLGNVNITSHSLLQNTSDLSTSPLYLHMASYLSENYLYYS